MGPMSPATHICQPGATSRWPTQAQVPQSLPELTLLPQAGKPVPGGLPGVAAHGLHLQRARSAPASQAEAADSLLPPLDEQELRARLRAQQQELRKQREEQDEWAAKARAVLAQRSGAQPEDDAASVDTASSQQAQRAGSTGLLALNGLIVRLQAEISDLAAQDRQYQVRLAAEAARQQVKQAQQAPPPAGPASKQGRQLGARKPAPQSGAAAGAAAWEERRAQELDAWEARQQRARKRQGRLRREEEGRAQREWRPEELLLQLTGLGQQDGGGAGPVRRSAPARLQAVPQRQHSALPLADSLPTASSLHASPKVRAWRVLLAGAKGLAAVVRASMLRAPPQAACRAAAASRQVLLPCRLPACSRWPPA